MRLHTLQYYCSDANAKERYRDFEIDTKLIDRPGDFQAHLYRLALFK